MLTTTGARAQKSPRCTKICQGRRKGAARGSRAHQGRRKGAREQQGRSKGAARAQQGRSKGATRDQQGILEPHDFESKNLNNK